ncbi:MULTISPECIES: mevalonate kinase [Lactococcus]|uniref:Mevalonate kinase n=2 Tax=Lactococcus TaxID=1357 RepID=A0A387BLC5_9LACT|nr:MULTISPECIES: mevalonate kinase [Lactococcus]AYG01816.1 mevalonate kinase [Lactococcus allomyrinae]MCL2113652.1 mevalonate kinase [Streptococcaceae bacterium]QDK70632.1 mevalonate kinase [Lactococcus protaetiae]
MTINKMGIGIAHSKLILIGEHSVVYGQPAIALPVTILKTTVTITASKFGQYIENNEFRRRLDLMGDEFEGIRQLIMRLLAKFHSSSMPFSLEIDSNIPLGRGLGASASLATAITRAIYDFFDTELLEKDLIFYANFSENITHGKSSGIDVATVNSEHPLWFIKDEAIEPFELNLHGFIVIGDTGVHGFTSQAINIVREKLVEEKQVTQAYIDQLGDLAKASKSFLMTNKLSELGQVMNKAHSVLSSLGVSHPRLETLVDVALKNGALGAKLTGSGLGGVMVALAENEKDAIRISQRLLKSGAKNTWIYSF